MARWARLPLSLSSFLIFVAPLVSGQDIAVQKVIGWGDPVEVTASDGSTVVASAQPITAQDAQIGWAGSYLGVNLAQGPVVWDGSVYALVVGENVSVPGYTADIPNRAGNPPEQPVLRASPLGLAVSASGQVAFSGTVDDRATPLVESAWEIVGIAGAGSLRQLAESSRPGVLQVFSSEGLVRLVDDIGQVNTGTGVETIVGWLDENGGEQRLWGHGDSAPGASGQKFTTAFDVLAHLPDKTLVVKVDVSPDGSFADSESVVYLVDPSGVVEFLFKMVGEPFAGVAGLVNAGTMNITDKREFRDATSLDINTSRVIAFSALLVPTGATAQSAVLRRISATEREVVATAGTEATLAGGGSLGVFESVDGSRLSINDAGDIIFEGTLVGESGPTIFRYHAADGSFERIGPAPGTAVPGAAGFVVTKASLRASNAADRLVIRIDGRDENFVTKWGYFLQKAAGGFEPFIWDKQVTIGGETLTLTGFVGDIELSETNVASVSVPLPSGPAVIAAQIASETPPVGNQYHWDGGAGTNDWYTVTGGRSNWVDSVGTPWPTPPGPGSDVFISTGASVHLTQPATVQNVTLADENAELVVASDLTFEFLLDVPTLSQLTLESGSVNSTAGKLRVAGGLRKTTASACRIDVAILDYHGNEWQVQQGDLTLHNGESWLASDLIEVLDGSLVVQDEVTRVQGPGLQLTVRQTAQADLGSNAIVLESNLVLEAVDDLAKIFLGKSGQRQNGTDPIAFVGGTIQAQRSLEVKGAGEIVIRQGFSIEPERAFIINTTAPFDRPGLIVDLSAGDLIYFDIDSPEMVLLSRLDIRGGGVIGNLVNEGLIVAGCSEHAVRLDCRNESVIEQVGDVNTGGLINEAGSTYKIIEGRLEASYDPGYGDRVIFRMGSRLVAEGTGEVAILNREDPTAPTIPMFEGANITVTNDARLTLHGTRMTGVVDVAVDKKDGEIVFDGLEFEDLHITGDGLASFSGGIICRKLGGNAQRGDSYALIQEAPLFVNTRNVSIKDATFSSEDGAHWFFFDDDFSSLLDEFVIDTLKVQSGVLLEVAPISASARSLELNSFARFEDLALFSSVTVDPAIMSTVEKSDPEYPELRVEMTLYVRNEAGGDLVIEPRLGPGRYAFSPYVPIRNTRLFVPTTTHFDRETRTLRSGDWVMLDDEGQLAFDPPSVNPWDHLPIITIGGSAKLTLKKRVPGQAQIAPGFPNRNDPLIVEGKLSLFGTIVEMNGNLLTVDGGRISLFDGAEIRGALKAVSPEIDGVLELARLDGNVRVTGNAEIDGTLGVGASPGSGFFGGDLTFGPNGRFEVEIGGLEPAYDFDQVTVGGTTALQEGAMIEVTLIDPNPDDVVDEIFLPRTGDVFDFLATGDLLLPAGKTLNDVVQFTNLPDGVTFDFQTTTVDGVTRIALAANSTLPPPAGPRILAHPHATSTTAGGASTFTVSVGSAPGTTYQWRKDGIDIPGANGPTLTLPATQSFDAGDYSVVVTAGGVSVESKLAHLEVAPAPPSNARLLNLSTRGQVLTGANVLIPGFVITGTSNKKLLLRAVGPRLGDFGVPDPLADPMLTLKQNVGGGDVDFATNDNWGSNANAADIATTSAMVGAFDLLPNSADAALLLDLPPGQYTAIAEGVGATSGVSIVELYDADTAASDSQLINISTRGFAGAGDAVIIPGFVISPEGPKTVLVRVIGPTLGSFGVPGAMVDPQLTILRSEPDGSQTELIANDDWSDSPDAANTAAVATQVGAFDLLADGKDAAVVVTLEPGAYTVVGSSAVAEGTGVVLVEVYIVP